MNAYFNLDNNTQQDVLKLISNFNKTNRNKIKLKFDIRRTKMNIKKNQDH